MELYTFRSFYSSGRLMKTNKHCEWLDKLSNSCFLVAQTKVASFSLSNCLFGLTAQWNIWRIIHNSKLLTSYFNESWCVYVFSQTYDQVSTIVLWWNLCNVHRFFRECISWTTQFERKCCIYAYKVVETFYLSIIVTKHYMSALELPKG